VTIHLTEAASQQIRNSISKRGKGLGLRVGIKRVGCSGFAYTFDYADALAEGDVTFGPEDARVVISGADLGFLDGSTLDFTREGLRQFFRFDNPNVTNTCGCGESFSVA
jgi:iron-sulfur cluster assembly protein